MPVWELKLTNVAWPTCKKKKKKNPFGWLSSAYELKSMDMGVKV